MDRRYRTRSSIWLIFVLTLFTIGLFLHPAIKLKTAFLLFVLCFFCEMIDSGLGMGYGTILTPTLLFMGYEPQDIVPTVLLSELLSGLTAAFFHHQIKNVQLSLSGRDFKPAIILAGGSIVGVTVGVFVAINLPKDALKLGIGLIILASGLFVVILSRRVIKYRSWNMLVLATVASFNKAASGGGYGPLVTSGQILSGVKTQASVGITSFAEAFTCLFAVTLFLAKGGVICMTLFIPMSAGALASVPIAVLAINRSREVHLKVIIGAVTMIMGGFTIYRALM